MRNKIVSKFKKVYKKLKINLLNNTPKDSTEQNGCFRAFLKTNNRAGTS